MKNSKTITMSNLEKLISEYQKKVEIKDHAIERIIEMIRKARKDNSIDMDNLREEKANANRDRQLYIQFISELEDLQH